MFAKERSDKFGIQMEVNMGGATPSVLSAICSKREADSTAQEDKAAQCDSAIKKPLYQPFCLSAKEGWDILLLCGFIRP